MHAGRLAVEYRQPPPLLSLVSPGSRPTSLDVLRCLAVPDAFDPHLVQPGLTGQSSALADDAFDTPRFDDGRVDRGELWRRRHLSSSLDPDERTLSPQDSLYLSFRHSGWRRQREAVHRAFLRFSRGELPKPSPTAFSLKVRTRFRYCGQYSWLFKSDDDPPRYQVRSSRCRNRFCLPCQQERGRIIAANLRDKLPSVKLRFMTLTVRADGLSLSAALDHLYKSFTALRRSRVWRRHVQGGLAVLEVSWSDVSRRWHPHFHILFQGLYFPHRELKAEWLRITGDSFIVDVRPATDVDHISGYLTKYLTKSIAKGVWTDDDRLAEAMAALHGRKLVTCFGRWARLRLLTPPDSDTCWTRVCSAGELLARARDGDQISIGIASSVFGRGFASWLTEHPP